ncbi:MAG TPA: HD domain-containing phosphohydrolase [Clostridia bacterium]|nr:HD domain-containing phosphohydrolase [Clostridia bacterium]
MIEDNLSIEHKEIRYVNRIISQVSRINDMDVLLDTVMDILVREFGISMGGIYLLNKKTGMAELCHSRGLSAEYVKKINVIDPAKNPHNIIFKDGQSIVTENFETLVPEAVFDESFYIRSAVVIPLVHDKKVIGSLNLSKREVPFTKDEVSMLESVGHSIGFVFQRISDKESLVKANHNFKVLLDSMQEMVFVLSTDGNIIEINKAVFNKLGYKREELLGNSIINLHSPSMRGEVAEFFTDIKNGKNRMGYSLPLLTKNDEFLEVNTTVTNGFWDGDAAVLGICRILSSENESERIRYFCDHDNLTDLLNRTRFEQKLQEIVETKRFPSTFVIMDIDGFGRVNEAFGYREGDQVLRHYAGKILEECGSRDILARWGEDEFAIIMEGVDEAEAIEKAERIGKKNKVVLNDFVRLELSFGVSGLGRENVSVKEVVAHAQEMMLHNKLFKERSIQNSIIVSIQKTIRERSLETEEHTERMAVLANEFALYLGIPKREKDDLLLLVTLHDVGKIGIPDHILLKEGPLTPSEWRQMEKHSAIGCRIIEDTKMLKHMGEYILSHHERWDGTGYPRGISGKLIPKICRILALIDTYDVMTNERPYKEPVSAERAIMEIKRCSGTQFDPELAGRFIDFMTDNRCKNTSANAKERKN